MSGPPRPERAVAPEGVAEDPTTGDPVAGDPVAGGPAADPASGDAAVDDLDVVVDRARHHEPDAVSRLVTVFEDTRPEAVAARARVLDLLDAPGRAAQPDEAVRPGGGGRPAAIVGITGAPGSGKSSLVARVTAALVEADPELSVAVVAVDPSSHVSGGALLGDRTRMPARASGRVFFRSQASDTALGGLAPTTFPVCRLLARLYDIVLVETVGIGQSEADVRHLADRVYLVLPPLAGDEVQLLKAGIVEIPDAFVLNKADLPAAAQTEHHLRSSLWLSRPFDADEVAIHRTSARTGEGVAELAAALREVVARGGDLDARMPHFFARWVVDEWGRVGTRFLIDQLGGPDTFLSEAGAFEAAQLAFSRRLRDHVGNRH